MRGCPPRLRIYAVPASGVPRLLRRLAGLDGQSTLLVAPQLHYCEGAFQWGVDVQDILFKLSLYSPQVRFMSRYAMCTTCPSTPTRL